MVGTAVSKVCDLEIARTGLKEADCDVVGYQWLTVSVASTTRAGYFPGAAEITVKLVVEKRTGRLLGGQIVGKEGAAKRIDALRGGAVEPDDGRGDLGAGPGLRATVLPGVGPGAHRGAEGRGQHPGRLKRSFARAETPLPPYAVLWLY